MGVTTEMTATAIRLVGTIAETDFRAIISKWQIEGSAPTPMQASQAELVGRAARIACGAQKTKAQQARENAEKVEHDIKMRELQRDIAKAREASTSSESGPRVGPADGTSTAIVLATPQKKMKMSTVANQADDTEMETLSDAKVNEFYKN